ncbi:hypothetical protein F4677DRAFT_361736 [Hypoxylon crocopeplum]|nr:hypothetical protein F4677DRAFT_361736 [Hypoxylon crocopeplum]
MSDPVSLTLAITPLVIEVVKGFQTLKTKLNIFSHYSREVKRIQSSFLIQRDFFQSECEILLKKAAVDTSQANELFEARQVNEASRELVNALSKYLGRRHEAFETTFKDIRSSLQSLQGELESFDEIDRKRQKGEPLRDAVKRLRYRIKITLNQSCYVEALDKLKQSNYDLKDIRKHAQELNSPDNHLDNPTPDLEPHILEHRKLSRVRLAVHAFYQAMSISWACDDKLHDGHIVKLFTNVEAKGEDVIMNVLLLGTSPSEPTEPQHTSSTGPIARNETLPCGEPLNPRQCDQFSLEVRSFVPNPVRAASWNESRPAKRRRITAVSRYNTNEIEKSERGPDIDALKTVGCMAVANRIPTEACLGYLEVPMQQQHRHSLYIWPGVFYNRDLQGKDVLSAPKPLNELFCRPMDEYYDVRDQLKLAKTMVSVVMKFNSTPWLDHWWDLGDICYLDIDNGMTGILDTLHLDAVLGHHGKPKVPEETHTDEQSQRGIKNIHLYNLGVALLQIDRWKDLDPKTATNIDKLASWSRMGPKYRDVVRRCLDCNFGVDYDLTKPELQAAVLKRVMGELDTMIAGLAIDDDDEDESQYD